MRDTHPRVSVLLPVYNAEATILRAVESIRAQTLTPWELLAVDDGSSDRTGALLRNAAKNDPRIRVITQDHAGVVTAANRALEAARGDFIARMDADDEAHPERLSRQVGYLEADPEIDLVGCQVEFGGDPETARGFQLHIDWLNSVLTMADHAVAQFLEYPLANPTMCGRREAWMRVGGTRDGDFPEDYEWFLRAMEAGLRIAKVPEPLLTWNDPPTRLTRNDGRYAVEAFFTVKLPFLARWLHRHVGPERSILIWGAGRTTRQRVKSLFAHGLPIAAWIDVDPKKIGGEAGGLPVLGIDALRQQPRPFVLPAVRSRGARQKILKHLETLGYQPVRDFMPLA